MKYTAVIDTPWHTVQRDGLDIHEPFINTDATLYVGNKSQLTKWIDVTGSEPHEWPVGSGLLVRGGNYAKATGAEKSGDPDYLMTQIWFTKLSFINKIIGDYDLVYWVYWYAHILPNGDLQYLAKGRLDKPDNAEFSKHHDALIQRGVGQGWADDNLGRVTDARKTRREYERAMKLAYLTKQMKGL